MNSLIVAAVAGEAHRDSPISMVFIPGGILRMGSDKHYPEEVPVHRVTVDAFRIDRTPVTNREFRKFVNATGYVTFAEIPPTEPVDTSTNHVGFRCVVRNRKFAR